MHLFDSPATTGPYDSPLDHLADEIEWVKVRCHRLGAEIEARDDIINDTGLADAMTAGDRLSDETRRKVGRLRASENNLRQRIDARINATGIALPVFDTAKVLDLDDAEAALLKLAVIPCVGLDLYETLSGIARFGFGLMSVSPEMVAVFAELDLRGRVGLRDLLGEEGKLVKAGLVECDWDEDRLADFWSSGVYLTDAGFRRLIGTA